MGFTIFIFNLFLMVIKSQLGEKKKKKLKYKIYVICLIQKLKINVSLKKNNTYWAFVNNK
jgi:hypothetical protein